MSNIRDAIKQLAKGSADVHSLICVVDAVDKEKRTVDCSPIDESAPLLSVNLQANQESKHGIVVYPKVGSYVVVSFVAEGSAGVVTLTDEIDSVEVVIEQNKATLNNEVATIQVGDDASIEITSNGIVMNGGGFGGLIKIEELTKKINDLIDAFNSHTHTIPTIITNGSATTQTAVQVAVPAPLSKAVKLNKADYEDVKVKH